ncbi:MAG: ATP-binding protein [Desulfobacteraceae bacterium]|jgi:PAS domain S-box-containing protein|nr:ATP-binding protein [Desulfobacteraceae bacterium]
MPTTYSRKQMIFLIRLVVIITTAYFIIFTPSSNKQFENFGYFFIAVYLFTNLIVAFMPKKIFYDPKIFYGLVLCDSIMLPAGIYFSGYVGSDLYLMYFFIVSLTTISSRFKYLIINALIFSVIYGWLLYQKGFLSGPLAISYSIRIPLILIITVFYGYLITIRLKDKDKKIQEIQDRYEQIVQATDVMMCIVDQDGKYLFTNQKFIEFYGFSDEKSLLGLTVSSIHNGDDEQAEKSLGDVKSVFQSNNTVQNESFDKLHGIWFANTLSPIRNPLTRAVSSVCIISKDITERVEKENKLNDTIELLRKTRDQLIQKDKMSALGRMASGIAHEIRNPLEIIYMGIDYLDFNLTNDNPHIRKSIDKMLNAVNRANNIIKNILSFSKKSTYKITGFPLCPLLDNVLSLAKHSIRKNNVKVIREYDDKLIEVAADFNMLEQVFLNLVNNAIYAMKDSNEKRLTIHVSKQTVSEIGYKSGYRQADFFIIGDKMVVVEISDTGKGIPAADLPKIFEPFYTTKPTNEGTGLGLSLSHMIMDRLSGIIDVKSRENQGTTFYIQLQTDRKKINSNEV